MKFKKIVLEEIDNLIKERFITELELSSYGKLMNKTSDYPWVKYLGNPELASKYKNINNLANELFTKAFYKKFEIGMEIKNGDEVYKFNGIKFNANYTNYYLYFKTGSHDYISIVTDNKNYYLSKRYGIEDNFDEESQKLLVNMLKYNF
jgi:hypothetical protein